jgi:23S rRNA (cytidine1920-2'-O)/16S rRNA (cytidine1409-2'-O)-methyltransferase
MTDRLRLDALLVARGLFPTRSRARDAIARGHVQIAGRTIGKAGLLVPGDVEIAVDDPAKAYVSRGALKLIAGLDHFRLDPKGTLALDIGASTGGFTEVLLKRGARRVVAVDVGHGQMAPQLAGDPRVVLKEGVNARDLALDLIGGERPDFLVADVSFISLTVVLPPALTIAASRAHGLFLVKPQFELGREAIGKRGRLRDSAAAEKAAGDIAQWLQGREGWRVLGICPSPIAGGEGNREFLLGARRGF